MHCVFEGIVKKLGELWFDTKYASENFNVSNLIDVIDSKLYSIKPPSLLHDIQDLLRGQAMVKTEKNNNKYFDQ